MKDWAAICWHDARSLDCSQCSNHTFKLCLICVHEAALRKVVSKAETDMRPAAVYSNAVSLLV